MHMTQSNQDRDTDVLADFVSRVDDLQPKVERIINAQQDMCSCMRRTADAC